LHCPFNYFVSHAIITTSFDENEICVLKKSIDVLGSILSQRAFDHYRLEFMFHKKQIPYIHAHTSHAPHVHIHTKVYTYTHCSRKDHLANFCYDKLHMIKNNVWVQNANIKGLKILWVPEGTPVLFDAAVSSLKM